MTAQDNLACQWFERVWNKNDVSAIAALTTPGMKAHGADGVTRNPETFAEFQRAMRSAMPDLQVEVRHSVEGRDMIAVHWVAVGTHSGIATGLAAPSNRRIEVSGLSLVRLEGNKIAEGWDTYDFAGLMRQLGVGV
jgi:predicted ester cyclase